MGTLLAIVARCNLLRISYMRACFLQKLVPYTVSLSGKFPPYKNTEDFFSKLTYRKKKAENSMAAGQWSAKGA